jgi:hypothetical protein
MRWRWRLLIAAAVIGIGAGLIWTATGSYHDAQKARADLIVARTALQTTLDNAGALRTADGRTQARARMTSALASIDAARSRLGRSTPLKVARFIPFLRRQRNGVFDLVADSRTGTITGRALLDEVDHLATTESLSDGQVPFAGLAKLAADTQAAGTKMHKLVRTSKGLFGPLADARDQLDKVARDAADRLTRGGRALAAASTFAGATGERHYLLAIGNNAEMRDDGAILSYGEVSFRNGKLSLDRDGSVLDIALKQPVPTAIPDGTDSVFGFIKPNQLWQSVNATADYTWSRRTMREMYRAATGVQVDGVITVDVPALAALLRVVGPVTVKDVAQQISADNVATVLLHDQYQQLPPGGSTTRRERLADLAHAVMQKLTKGRQDVVALGRELGDAAAGGHLRLWSATSTEEQAFEQTGLGGGPSVSEADRTFHLAIENRTATKLDYYIRTHVEQRVTLTKNNTAIVDTTVTVDNTAPSGPPNYQLGPDPFGNTDKAGEYIAWVLLWGPRASQQHPSVEEAGLQLSEQVPTVGPGQKVAVSFQTVIPEAVRKGHLRLRFVPQATLNPADVKITLRAPDWIVIDGANGVNFTWDRTKVVDWTAALR